MLAEGKDSERSQAQLQHNLASLQAMQDFADNATTCRRVLLMRHFSDPFDSAECRGATTSLDVLAGIPLCRVCLADDALCGRQVYLRRAAMRVLRVQEHATRARQS